MPKTADEEAQDMESLLEDLSPAGRLLRDLDAKPRKSLVEAVAPVIKEMLQRGTRR